MEMERNCSIINFNTVVQFNNRSDTLWFVQEMANKNTSRKTKADILLTKMKEDHQKTSPPNELDTFLARYFLNAKKGNDTEYEPDILE
ncbi:hypothetical protein KUTeg_020700 [Tegillarca granosa]|uniref:Uncharacterized protein n=1 Tax=Tegillarca granosa TaxID=220873 RepID=A0ABQ9E8P8_TEGGR|nr:hypothetical protein KUTeg_020700 [Tegillarca granosa]